MTIGFNYGGSTNAIPDKTMTRKSKPKVLTANFGDGYQQRIADGINSIDEVYTLRFKNREKAFIDDVVDFLDGKKGVTNFDFVVPDPSAGSNEKTIKVICSDYSTNFEYDNFYTLTTTFKRVYEP